MQFLKILTLLCILALGKSQSITSTNDSNDDKPMEYEHRPNGLLDISNAGDYHANTADRKSRFFFNPFHYGPLNWGYGSPYGWGYRPWKGYGYRYQYGRRMGYGGRRRVRNYAWIFG
ncbi:uncharacterized protein LOC142237482 [Haematobia irritans]|uniref:uncharacterized protein LOC142237482 n=1 Tax=Haematobia irritans TaxID=7368 RepID=UPI003F4FDDAD